MNLNLSLLFILLRFSNIYSITLRSFPLDTIQFFNTKMLNNSLEMGWNHFCHTDVDEDVMSLFPECSPSSVEILLRNEINETIRLTTKQLSEISEFNFGPRRRTILIINGVSDPQTLDVSANLQYLQEKLTNFNVVIVDFGTNIQQIFNTVKRSVRINAFLVSKILGELKKAGLNMATLTIVGHSVGANIAALGAKLFSEETNGKKLPLLIALDPALMCSKEEVFVNPSVCKKVVVIHGENSVLSVKDSIGTVDIYLNGDDGTHQPGCSTSLCSHMYPLMLFIRILIDDLEVLAFKCKDWPSFRRGKCNFNDSLKVGLNYDKLMCSEGTYYSIADKCSPYEREIYQWNQVELLDKDAELIPLDIFSDIDSETIILK